MCVFLKRDDCFTKQAFSRKGQLLGWRCLTGCQMKGSETTVTAFHTLWLNGSETTMKVYHGLSAERVRNYRDNVSQVVSWTCQKPRWQCFIGCQLNVSETMVSVFHRLSAERATTTVTVFHRFVRWTCQKLRCQCFPGCQLLEEGRLFPHSDNINCKEPERV